MTYEQAMSMRYELIELLEEGKEDSPRAKELARKLRNEGY